MLPNNAKCAWCGKLYRIVPHHLMRKIREGKPTCCSISCGHRYANNTEEKKRERQAKKDADKRRMKERKLAIWKEGYDQCLVDYNLEVL